MEPLKRLLLLLLLLRLAFWTAGQFVQAERIGECPRVLLYRLDCGLAIGQTLVVAASHVELFDMCMFLVYVPLRLILLLSCPGSMLVLS